VGIAERCLVRAQAQQASGDRRGGEGLAHAKRPEPGRVGTDNLVEGEQRCPGREGSVRDLNSVFTLNPGPARQRPQ
jgi:hypothetical protein